jgi:hypothetical protein
MKRRKEGRNGGMVGIFSMRWYLSITEVTPVGSNDDGPHLSSASPPLHTALILKGQYSKFDFPWLLTWLWGEVGPLVENTR